MGKTATARKKEVQEMRFTAIDIETTGLSPLKEKIIEIGAVRYEDGVRKAVLSTLVCPRIAALPVRITELTGITEEMLKNAPEEEEAMNSLFHFLEGETVLLGHNIPFDYSFLKTAAERMGAEFSYDGIDTLLLARQCCPDLPSKTLAAMCEAYGIINARAHRACEDACAAAELYFCLLERFGKEQEAAFVPKPLCYRPKKMEPVTGKQCRYLASIIAAHGLELKPNYEAMTKSEASRLIDTLLARYGRI